MTIKNMTLTFLIIVFSSYSFAYAESSPSLSGGGDIVAEAAPPPEEDEEFEGFEDSEEDPATIKDPFEPLNRVMFKFNDKLYFLVLEPLAQGYNKIVPEKARIGVSRFFSNLTTPIRFVNSLLQFKFDRAGTELSRFLINTTVGLAGFMDPAREKWKISKHKEDFGQTMGFFGSGPGFYVNWPILGPSSLRDSIGMVLDLFLDPTTYLFPHEKWGVSVVRAYDRVNETSLNIDLYESLKKDAFDPYTFFRDAYHQHRESMIKE